MKCPFCAAIETKVVDSRLNQQGDITRRRRSCLKCEGRFTTYERVEELMPAIIKRDGRREPYDREKMQGGIMKACQKLKVPIQKIDELVDRIEKRTQSFGVKEIPSQKLGDFVMIELHQLDKVAYIRFASVYRKFKDVDEFLTEIKNPSEIPVEMDPSEPELLSFSFMNGDAP